MAYFIQYKRILEEYFIVEIEAESKEEALELFWNSTDNGEEADCIGGMAHTELESVGEAENEESYWEQKLKALEKNQ